MSRERITWFVIITALLLVTGLLIGRQGEGNAPGDLFTTESFDDFELQVTYRMVWPGNSGVWYRYQAANKTFQADILEYGHDPFPTFVIRDVLQI